MKRFTTDNPQNNFETMMNLVYAKDGWQHIRHGDTDMKTTDFCLELCKARECEPFGKCNTDEEKDECLCSCLFDGCPIAMVYAALCGYGHTRSRLKMYEDMDMEPKWINVKERLPENAQRCIVITGFQCHDVCVATYYEISSRGNPNGDWIYEDADGWQDTVAAAYWMPLPKLPEEAHE